MPEKTDQPWVTKDAAVAVYYNGGFQSSVTPTTVERLTSTMVVCANGAKFYRYKLRDSYRTGVTGLQRVGDAWGCQLLPADDPRVRAVLAQDAFRSLTYKIEKIFKGSPHRGEAPEMLSVLDEMNRLIAEARANILRHAAEWDAAEEATDEHRHNPED